MTGSNFIRYLSLAAKVSSLSLDSILENLVFCLVNKYSFLCSISYFCCYFICSYSYFFWSNFASFSLILCCSSGLTCNFCYCYIYISLSFFSCFYISFCCLYSKTFYFSYSRSYKDFEGVFSDILVTLDSFFTSHYAYFLIFHSNS